MRVIRWQADRKACRAAWASDKQAYTRDCISNHFIQSILQQHRCTFSLGGYRTTPRLLQNHWLTGRPRYGQTDTRTEGVGICAASRAFVFSRWISLTENQWRCTLTETQSNQKSKDDGGLTCNSRARTYSYTVAAGLRLRKIQACACEGMCQSRQGYTSDYICQLYMPLHGAVEMTGVPG